MGILKRIVNIAISNLVNTRTLKRGSIDEEDCELKKIIEELEEEYQTKWKKKFNNFSDKFNNYNCNENNYKSDAMDSEVLKAFKLLGLDINASEDEIKSTFKRKIKQIHPDAASRNNITANDAKKQTMELLNAYNIIKNYKNIK